MSFRSRVSDAGARGWTAVDFNDGVWALSLRPPSGGEGRPTITSFGGQAGVDDPSGVLRQTVSGILEPGFGLTTVLRADEYQLMLVERPAVRDEEMPQSLRWTLDSRVDYPTAEASIAWFDLPPHDSLGNRARQIYLVAARKSVVDERARMLEIVAPKVDAVDIRETARRNLASLIEDRGQSGVFLLVAEPTGLQITVTFGGELYLERFIREKVLDIRAGDVEARDRQHDRIALELQRTLDFLRRNFPFIPIEDLHIGPLPSPVGLQPALAARLTEPVRALDLAEFVDFPVGSDFDRPEVQARYLTALGAALRFRDAVVV